MRVIAPLLLLAGCGCPYDVDEASAQRLTAYCARAAACGDGAYTSAEECEAANAGFRFSDDCDLDGCAVQECVARYQDDPGCTNGVTTWIPPECGRATCGATQ